MSTLKSSSRQAAGPSSALSRRRPDSRLRAPQNLAKCECELVGGLGWPPAAAAAPHSARVRTVLFWVKLVRPRRGEGGGHHSCAGRLLHWEMSNQIFKTFVIKSTMSSIVLKLLKIPGPQDPLFFLKSSRPSPPQYFFRRSRSHASNGQALTVKLLQYKHCWWPCIQCMPCVDTKC